MELTKKFLETKQQELEKQLEELKSNTNAVYGAIQYNKLLLEELNKKEEGRIEEGKRVCCYIDGGVMCNYPVNICIEDQQCDPDEILGFRNMREKHH